MFRTPLLKIALLISVACAAAAPAWAQWTTPTIDGQINSGEYGNNNQLNNAGNTGQTWYMTWDATNLYVGIANANVNEGLVLYVADPNNNSTGNLTGFNYDGVNFSSLPFRATFVTYVKSGYREYRNSNGGGGWGSQTANYGQYADDGGGTREVAIPWSALTGGGIPSQFVFFGYLVSAGGYVYGQAPSDNNIGGFAGLNATATQYFAVVNTGNGTSTPPFSMEQPGGFSTQDKAGFYHNTFDPFYRDQEGAVPENTQVTLRFRTLHSSGIWSVNARAYLFDSASGNTTGPVDTDMPFDQNITINGTEYDVWKTTLTMPSSTSVYYYKFHIYRGPSTSPTNGWYSDDYLDDNDNVHKDGTGAASDGEPFPSFQFTVFDPNFQTPAWLQNANVYHILPDRFRNGDQTNDYCRTGSTTGCPTFYGGGGTNTVIHYDIWNTQMCDPRNPNSPCYNNFTQFYNGDLLGVQNELDYIQSLGFDTIYLNPIFMARSYHRYDTDQYLHIDPALGGDAAFTALQAEMNRRGMKVILDGVFNHSSSDGLYFDRYHRYPTDGACESLSSVWRSWIHFNDSHVPCNSSDYTGWFGFDSLPTFDHTNPAVQDFFYRGPGNVTQYWYNQGANGWRFDVADDGNFGHLWWNDYRTFAKSYNANGPLIGEIWPNASQWLAGDQMDSVMNYRFRKNITGFVRNADWSDDNNNGTNNIPGLTPSLFDHAIRAVRDDYPPQATAAMLNLLDSHDVNRALFVMTETGDTGLVQAKQRLKLAALFQFTYIGAPMVYYGDEIAVNSPSQTSSANGPIGDPYTRPPYPWLDQDGNPNIYGPPDTNMQAFYTKLAHIRKLYQVLRQGSFVTLLTGDTQQQNTAPSTYAFARTMQGQDAVVVALNNGPASNQASIPVAGIYTDGTSLYDVLGSGSYTVGSGAVQVTLPARTGVLLVRGPIGNNSPSVGAGITLSPGLNGSGWSNSPVTVELRGNDSGSGIEQLRYWIDDGPVNVAEGNSAALPIAAEGSYVVGLRAIDNAGYVSRQATQIVRIDLQAPAVAVTGVQPGATYSGNAPAAGCTTIDALSGVATKASVSISGGNGRFTATCSGGKDNAGNVAQPVSVTYFVVGSTNH
ncbi:MAG TPA: alpha-amylase family glycosyl hydrolase [Candidatus Limnocylindrales bacterium]|nr:alpha-amylase family glycosyl hydrolase [Candidatus Limnocylindrales bacterium]